MKIQKKSEHFNWLKHGFSTCGGHPLPLPFLLVVDQTSWIDSLKFIKIIRILIFIYKPGAVETEITCPTHRTLQFSNIFGSMLQTLLSDPQAYEPKKG